MIIPQNWYFNYDEKISNDEYEVIYKFLASYRNQNVIIADSFRQDFDIISLEQEEIIFKTNKDTWKNIDFCKRIYYKGKSYVIELELWRVNHRENDPKCLSIHEFRIITNGAVHFIDLNTRDSIKNNILFNIISIFNEGKIISPAQAYGKQMYTNKALQEFISNHQWKKINEGIMQYPSLANALFIIREGYESCSHFNADFGTILYQLISFRQNNQNDFDKKDLLELDKLILKLSKTELLKIQLHETTGGCKSWPTGSVLLESNNYNGRVHLSKQYTVTNTELTKEKRTLNKCIKTLKK
ncbi:MAG: hypothetical protein NC181_02810 [Clostridium sp.]|nr:hypothetical protein [Clostridium sp.]MCM1444107.1 hypothetical protein [Candidatus Amulumruptor caecigallinarius]